MQIIIQNTIMNLTVTLSFVCLVAFKACNANKILLRGSGHLSKRQVLDLQTPAPCNPCVLPNEYEIPPALEFLNILGQIAHRSKDNFQEVFDSTFDSPEELRTAIHKNLEAMKDNTLALINLIPQELGNTDSCPPLRALYDNLRKQYDSFLSQLITKFDESVTDADPNTVLATLVVAMASDIPYYLELIRDLLIYCVDVYATDDCEVIEPIISTTLNPSGNISNALIDALISPGIISVHILTNMIGSLLPNVDGGTFDYIHIAFQLLCASERVLRPSKDFSERTGGYCPQVPETFSFKDDIKKLLCGIADLVDVVLPSETVGYCPAS